MWDCLRRKGLFSRDPIAWSLGGDRDVGGDMDSAGRMHLLAVLEERGFRIINNPDLLENTSQRMDVFLEAAEDHPIKAFINVGGGWANLGTDAGILEVGPGLSMPDSVPLPERKGMIQKMAARGIPVIHCLFIRGLAREYGLSWDPSPLPEPGEGDFYGRAAEEHPSYMVIILSYILFAGLLIAFARRPRL